MQPINRDKRQPVIRRQAASNYPAAVTKPFKAKATGGLAGLHDGDKIHFSFFFRKRNLGWLDEITKSGTTSPPPIKRPADDEPATVASTVPGYPLLYYHFTNEPGHTVSLNDFRGQTLASAFFYTRYPLPEYSPRLSKNFQDASRKLASMTNEPASMHFISVSVDTEFDSPELWKAYRESYHYNPGRWSFLTGPPDKIGELARQSGVMFEFDAGTFNHNSRTLIIDAARQLQLIFPTTGDLSDQIVAELVKAAAVTNRSASTKQSR